MSILCVLWRILGLPRFAAHSLSNLPQRSRRGSIKLNRGGEGEVPSCIPLQIPRAWLSPKRKAFLASTFSLIYVVIGEFPSSARNTNDCLERGERYPPPPPPLPPPMSAQVSPLLLLISMLLPEAFPLLAFQSYMSGNTIRDRDRRILLLLSAQPPDTRLEKRNRAYMATGGICFSSE